MKRWLTRYLSVTLAAAMLAAFIPWVGGEKAKAAGSYEDVLVNGTKIYNKSTIGSNPAIPNDAEYEDGSDAGEYDAFIWFQRSKQSPLPGVFFTMDDKDDLYGTDKVDDDFHGTITVSQIPALKQLALSGQGEFRFFVRNLYESDDDFVSAEISTSVSGYRKYAENEEDKMNTGWQRLDPNDVITIDIVVDGSATMVGVHLYFRDVVSPTIKDYIFDTNGTERDNATIDEKELFLKKDEQLALAYPFSEPLKSYSAPDAAELNGHLLFTNPDGTGLPGAGENQGMKLPSTTNWSEYTDKLAYTYQPSGFHHTGNLPIMNGGELDSLPSGINLNGKSLKQKIIDAEFHDAAGNPLDVSNFGLKADAGAGTVFIRGKAVNPFDSTADTGNPNDGYRVIVDAVPPKYSFVANGIQPDILTGSTLNKGDTIDFKVQLTEDAIAKQGLSPSGLFLYFNNGMKAYYVEGENSRLWTFRATVTENDLDVALLKVIALTHESRAAETPGYSDRGVIQDYAGNLLMDRVNTSKSEAPVPTDPSQQVSDTKIDWAKLSIDNTAPSFSYVYDADGATAGVWGKTGRITVNADDPEVTAPALDPAEAGVVRPSRGIYRPLDMTGSPSGDSPGVGLVYYYWSQSGNDPLAGKEGDQFAAIKRYSLTGQQPAQGLYSGQMTEFKLMVANNKTNLLSPPATALTADSSGPWYLHTWTADMTWDTARQLMQYEKMKSYKSNHAAQYSSWQSEYLSSHPGSSDADAEFYATGKALEAVGDYSDLTLWTQADFKHDDSNWIYNHTSILLDNKAPDLTAAISGVNNTAEVKATVEATDAHSGYDPDKLQFQWVKAGGEPGELDWQPVPVTHIVTTLNNVIEDGEYVLYLKVSDKAGNPAAFQMREHAVVNSTRNVSITLSPEAADAYVKSSDITVAVSGTAVEELRYAYSSSVIQPADSLYHTTVVQMVYGGPAGGSGEPVIGQGSGATVTGAVYGIIPADYSLNGQQYLHVRAKEQGSERYYDYNALYRFDNAAPAVTFSLNGLSYPRSSHSVGVTATELYNQPGMSVLYQWVQESAAPPDESSAAWLPLPDSGKAVLDGGLLSPGESANFMLYVYSIDGAGNSSITHTGTFKLFREDNTPVEVLQSDLVAFTGNASDGYQAVVQLELKSTSKEGFEYSVSKDEGATWTVWRPYTNFVQISVPETAAGQLKLKAKFRSPSGVESRPAAIDTHSYNPAAEPLYGLVSYSTLKPAGSSGVTLTLTVPTGVKAVPSATDNPVNPERTKGNSFKITQNGLYTFDLTDLTAPERKGKLLAVVKNVDTTPPEGVVEYNLTAPTAANVTVKLITSEPVRILNNGGRDSYIFKENGSFTFEFADEAGNTGTATATVANIDRTPPSVHVAKSYTYGTNGSKSFRTIRDGNGNVVLTTGVKLTVEKDAPGGEGFLVVKGSSPTVLLENKAVEFVIRDQQGNTAALEEEAANIAPELEQPQLAYEYADQDGNALSPDKIVTINGKTYAKGQIKVTLSGQERAPNKIFHGAVPVVLGNGYANIISNDEGAYSYSAIYKTNGSTRIVLSDLLGRTIVSAVQVDGLDNTPPVITLNRPVASVLRNQTDFDPLRDLGGYTVSDNVSDPAKLKVTASGVDLTRTGKQTVIYTVTDEVGNTATVSQQVVVLNDSGLLITGNGQLLSASLNETVLFDTNRITFQVVGYDKMNVEGQDRTNEQAEYTLFYHSGLYREGQMKYIAEEMSFEKLLDNQYHVVFPKTGWYTLIVRTQEREREFVSFFIGSTDQ